MRAGIFFIGLILAILAGLLVYSLTYPYNARLFPWLIGIPTLVLIAAQLVREIFPRGKPEKNAQKGAVKKSVSWASSFKNLHPYLLAIAWIGGFILMLYLVGYFVAIPLFLFLYLKLHGGRWLTTIGICAGITIIVYVGFVLYLKVPFYEGVLFS